MWIVSGNDKERVRLISSKQVDGLLPIGSYLTVSDDKEIKHVLLVEESYPTSLFEPSPLIVDAGLPFLTQDQICKNIILATEVKQFPLRSDGLYSIIKPNQIAKRTTQDEINETFPTSDGFSVFLATNYQRQCALLQEDSGKFISVKIPYNSLYLQTMICGQTGSGKTVAMKYLIEQFLQHEKGAVLAINVKSIDLLTMDKTTIIQNPEEREKIEKEWASLDLVNPDFNEMKIYMPNSQQRIHDEVAKENVRRITLRTEDLEPNSLLGVLQNVTDRAAETLPNIFRYWKNVEPSQEKTFRTFIKWFRDKANKEAQYTFPTQNQSGEPSETPLHPGTCRAILQSLETASAFFDNQEYNCIAITEDHILVPGKLSVIDLSSKDTLMFGSVLLRHLLSKIYEAKAIKGQSIDLPVLIVIDEVHQFYRSTASSQALEELNAIARMGRSEKIGVIFASQNPEDLPEGLTSIVNTRIFFRSLGTVSRKYDISASGSELSTLANGYAIISNVSLPQIRSIKFPMSLRGVKS